MNGNEDVVFHPSSKKNTMVGSGLCHSIEIGTKFKLN
jgi:hypothetical protein